MKAPKHLLHSQDDQVGFTRKRHGKGFSYYDEKGKKLADTVLLHRLNRIGIPPAWNKVWICKEELGCLQASGRDERGRKQYIYHPDWALYRNLDKFENLYRFGEDLGKIRAQVWRDIEQKGWPKEKVVALATAILDETYVRIGNKYYTDTNQTYGLTTLRRRHMQTHANKVVFSYIAKGSKALKITLENRKLCKLIKACADLPGYELFRYLDEHNVSHPISSQDVNEYLRTLTGEEYSAKDFRTWGGTVTALETLEVAREEQALNSKRNLTNIVIKKVSQVLCNTVSICRKYYIHPAILSAIEKDTTEPYLEAAEKEKAFPELDLYERQLMLILKDYYKNPKK